MQHSKQAPNLNVDREVLFIYLLTLIGMRGDTFISLSFLDQILSAEFRSNIFGGETWVNLTPCQAHWVL